MIIIQIFVALPPWERFSGRSLLRATIRCDFRPTSECDSGLKRPLCTQEQSFLAGTDGDSTATLCFKVCHVEPRATLDVPSRPSTLAPVPRIGMQPCHVVTCDALILQVVKAVEQHTMMPLQDAGGDNRFSALYALLDSEDTKPVHVSRPLPSLPASSPDLGSHIFACSARRKHRLPSQRLWTRPP